MYDFLDKIGLKAVLEAIKGKMSEYASKELYGDTTINVGRLTDSAVGKYSTAEGWNTTASNEGSHAEGIRTISSGYTSHAEGYYTTASSVSSHAEGTSTRASGNGSHAEGSYTTASGIDSHAEGSGATASGNGSHAEGSYTIANNEAEHASGKFNVSNEDTLFSVGDGVNSENRHNAFEITKTGGKLHDKDIATTDLIPTSLPANGGNADMVDGLHADDFVSAAAFNQTQIPSNVDVPAWIHANGKRYQQYMTNGTNIGTTNIPNNSTDYVWYWFDGVNIIAREWAIGKLYICDVINGVFSGWKDVYTSGYKPYVVGNAPLSAGSVIVNSNHGFTPSAVFWWIISEGRALRSAYSFDNTSFRLPSSPTSDVVVNFIIFK